MRPRYVWGIALLICLAGFGLRIWQLGRASLWVDEMLTERRAQASLMDSFDLVLESGNQTPLYFILLHLFPTDSEFLLRLPSVLISTAAIGLLMFVVMRLYHDETLALLTGALAAINPFHIWLSRMARPYPLVFLLSILASYFFLLLLRGPRTRSKWIGFILASMAAYLTHYYTIALPLAQYVLFAFILSGQRKFFRQWIGAQLVAVIPLMIWVYALTRREQVAFGIGWIQRPGIEDIPITFWNMTVGYDGSVSWYVVIGLIAAAAGLLPGLYYAFRERKTNRVNFYWFWLVITPLVVGFAVSLFRPLYVDRYFMVLLPALLLLMAYGWTRLPSRNVRVALVTVFVVASLLNVLATLDKGIDEKEDWRSAAAYVDREQLPGDGLLAESPIELMAVLRYLDSDPDHAWLLDAPDPTEQYDQPVKRVWAIYRNPDEDGHRQGVLSDFDPFESSLSPMPDWLQGRRDQIVSLKEFNGVTILLLDTGDQFTGAE